MQKLNIDEQQQPNAIISNLAQLSLRQQQQQQQQQKPIGLGLAFQNAQLKTNLPAIDPILQADLGVANRTAISPTG